MALLLGILFASGNFPKEMKNHYRIQPKINAVSALIAIAYLSLLMVCLTDSAKPETLTPQSQKAPLANRNLGSNSECVKLIGGIEIRP